MLEKLVYKYRALSIARLPVSWTWRAIATSADSNLAETALESRGTEYRNFVILLWSAYQRITNGNWNRKSLEILAKRRSK